MALRCILLVVLLFSLLFAPVEAFRVPPNSRAKSGGRRKHSQRAVDEFRTALQEYFDRRLREASIRQCAIPKPYVYGQPEMSSGICTEDQRDAEEILAAFQEHLTHRAKVASQWNKVSWW